MNKFIAIILLFTLLLTCLMGCSSHGTNNDKEKPDKGEDKIELYDLFDIIRADAEKIEKLNFTVEREELYYELKSSGEYDNSRWLDAMFEILLICNYDIAVNEDWYKQCSVKDTESLNAAFYNQYSAGLSKGKYSNIVFSPGMYLIYYSPEDFNNDYANIKALEELDYVTRILIQYKFPIPLDYMIE